MFSLDEEQGKKMQAWIDEHDKTCKCFHKQGAIGGRLRWCFTPTSIGVAIIVECACGEEVDLSDYDSW